LVKSANALAQHQTQRYLFASPSPSIDSNRCQRRSLHSTFLDREAQSFPRSSLFMIEKIREAVELFAANFRLFCSIVLTVWLPGSILIVYLRLYVFPGTTGGDEMKMFVQEYRVSNLIELAFGPLYIGAIIYAASRLKQGLAAKYRASMAYAATKSFKLLRTRIGTGLIVFVGVLALIIPGIVLALRFALTDPIVVLEDLEGGSARNLSVKLTKGKRWEILGAIILTYMSILLSIFLSSFILYLPLSLIGKTENFIIAVICECISNILLVLPTIVLFLFYWEAKNQAAVAVDRDN
jgi:hypothetical protein